MSVSIAEAILWGEQHGQTFDCLGGGNGVSIAEAILWGEQPQLDRIERKIDASFNRRGDSLGGATN